MSSLPAWRCSASSLRNAPIAAASIAIDMRKIGMPIKNATTRITTPNTPSASHVSSPGLDFDEGAERQATDADRRAGGAVVAEGGHVHVVHGGEVVHVSQEHRRLHDDGHGRAFRFE